MDHAGERRGWLRAARALVWPVCRRLMMARPPPQEPSGGVSVKHLHCRMLGPEGLTAHPLFA